MLFRGIECLGLKRIRSRATMTWFKFAFYHFLAVFPWGSHSASEPELSSFISKTRTRKINNENASFIVTLVTFICNMFVAQL